MEWEEYPRRYLELNSNNLCCNKITETTNQYVQTQQTETVVKRPTQECCENSKEGVYNKNTQLCCPKQSNDPNNNENEVLEKSQYPNGCPATCKGVYGNNFTPCGDSCCDSTSEQCCQNDNKLKPVCCNKEPLAQCDVNLIGIKSNSCEINECIDGIKCTIGGKTICCPIDKPICATQTVGIWPLNKDLPTCITKENDKCDNPCAKTDKGDLCCKPTEKCDSILGFNYCKPMDCDKSKGETFCPGEEDFTGKFNKCCPTGTVCFPQPNGFPDCVKTTSPTKNKNSLFNSRYITEPPGFPFEFGINP